jgi:hypothetical protein
MNHDVRITGRIILSLITMTRIARIWRFTPPPRSRSSAGWSTEALASPLEGHCRNLDSWSGHGSPRLDPHFWATNAPSDEVAPRIRGVDVGSYEISLGPLGTTYVAIKAATNIPINQMFTKVHWSVSISSRYTATQKSGWWICQQMVPQKAGLQIPLTIL